MSSRAIRICDLDMLSEFLTVVGCRDATARLKTGDGVRVDGSAGTVMMS